MGVDIKRQAREHNSSVAEILGDLLRRFIEGTIADANVTFGEYASTTPADVAGATRDTARRDRANGEMGISVSAHRAVLSSQLASSSAKVDHGCVPTAPRHGIPSERRRRPTDALRAHILRLLGYRVDVMEFVEAAHTLRNTLIRAIKTNAPRPERIGKSLTRYARCGASACRRAGRVGRRALSSVRKLED